METLIPRRRSCLNYGPDPREYQLGSQMTYIDCRAMENVCLIQWLKEICEWYDSLAITFQYAYNQRLDDTAKIGMVGF